MASNFPKLPPLLCKDDLYKRPSYSTAVSLFALAEHLKSGSQEAYGTTAMQTLSQVKTVFASSESV
jgi:hypothetical protein